MTDSVKHLTQNDLANRWSKSVHTIERYRCDGTGPVYHQNWRQSNVPIYYIEAFESERRFQRPDVHKPVPPKAVSGLMLHEAISQLTWNHPDLPKN
jgi:hypothetical protein